MAEGHLIIDLRIGERNRNVSSLVGTVVLWGIAKREISREYCDIKIMMITMTISIGSLCGDYNQSSDLDLWFEYDRTAPLDIVPLHDFWLWWYLRSVKDSDTFQTVHNTKHQSFHAKTASPLFLSTFVTLVAVLAHYLAPKLRLWPHKLRRQVSKTWKTL